MPEIPLPPPIADQPLSVVLVADLASNLPEVVQTWSAHLQDKKREHEIIVVLPPGQSASDLPAAKVVAADRPGFGAALRAGFAQAQHPLLLYLPASPEWRPEFLSPFLERIDKVHLVNGVRTGRPTPFPLRCVGFLYRCLVRVIFGIPLPPLPGWLGWKGHAYQRLMRWTFGTRLSDLECPFRLLRRQILERMPIQSDGRFVHVELLAKTTFLTLYVDETPLPVPAAETNAPWFQEFRQVFDDPDFNQMKAAPRPA